METEKVGVLIFDLVINFLAFLGVKGRDCCQHFVDYTAERPPVALFTIVSPEDDFWSQVLCSPAKTRALGISH